MAPIATTDLTDSISRLQIKAAIKRAALTEAPAHLEVESTEAKTIDEPDKASFTPSTLEWPRELKSQLAWDGADYCDSKLYTYHLSEDEILEADQALKNFKSLNLGGNEISRETFSLPSLGARLDSLAQELHTGRGFCNIRGLKPEAYSPEDNILLYLGISSYLGEIRGKQDDDGYMLAHVRDSKLSAASQDDRPFRDSHLKLTFHTDGYTDILGMQTRSCAATGGNHIIASTWKIYNELAATRPDLLEILKEPNWHFDIRGRFQEPGARSLFFFEDGHVIMNFVRYLLTGLPKVPRSEHLPACTPKQVEALDAIEILAQKHQLVLDMQPGDLTFLNNWAILHSREAFEDNEDHVRYLVRIWLKNEKLAWKLPPALDYGNQMVYYDDELPEKWNIVPQPRLKFKIYQTLSP